MNTENDSLEPPRPHGDMQVPVVSAMRRYATSPWTDERIELVRTLWSQGVSAQRIARELGAGISRGAVLGKIHRLGIVEMSPNSGARRSERNDAQLVVEREHDLANELPASQCEFPNSQRELPAWVRDAAPYIDDPLVDADIPASQRRALLELSDRACRWPVGDPCCPDFFFCGAEAFPGKPYCVAHCARGYRREEATTPSGRAPALSRARISAALALSSRAANRPPTGDGLKKGMKRRNQDSRTSTSAWLLVHES
jgi:GcrA cell cycle regulator